MSGQHWLCGVTLQSGEQRGGVFVDLGACPSCGSRDLFLFTVVNTGSRATIDVVCRACDRREPYMINAYGRVLSCPQSATAAPSQTARDSFRVP